MPTTVDMCKYLEGKYVSLQLVSINYDSITAIVHMPKNRFSVFFFLQQINIYMENAYILVPIIALVIKLTKLACKQTRTCSLKVQLCKKL